MLEKIISSIVINLAAKIFELVSGFLMKLWQDYNRKRYGDNLNRAIDRANELSNKPDLESRLEGANQHENIFRELAD